MAPHYYRTNGNTTYNRERARAKERLRIEVEHELARSPISRSRTYPVDLVSFIMRQSGFDFVPGRPIRENYAILIKEGQRITDRTIGRVVKAVGKDYELPGYFARRNNGKPDSSKQRKESLADKIRKWFS